jgi:hypothetical protein
MGRAAEAVNAQNGGARAAQRPVLHAVLEWQNSWPDVTIANTPTSEVSAETTNARCATSACLSGSMIASNAICKFADAANEIDYERTAVNRNEKNLGKTRLFYIPWYKLISLFC